jgi:hypothetical protein
MQHLSASPRVALSTSCRFLWLIIDSLHELRQRRPVCLSEESLVELGGQGISSD